MYNLTKVCKKSIYTLFMGLNDKRLEDIFKPFIYDKANNN